MNSTSSSTESTVNTERDAFEYEELSDLPEEANMSGSPGEANDEAEDDEVPPTPPFILYKDGEDFATAMENLQLWVNGLLLPVYGREVSSSAPWCPRWWEHIEAVAQLYGLWMAWQNLTGPHSPMSGPSSWHRDHLGPVMMSLRDPQGPFSGCKTGSHRPKEAPHVETAGY